MAFALLPATASNDDAFADEATGVFTRPTSLPAPPRIPAEAVGAVPPPRARRLFLVVHAVRAIAATEPPPPSSPPSARALRSAA